GAVELNDRALALAADADPVAGRDLEERSDRDPEGRGEPAHGVKRRRQAPRFDLRDHRRRERRRQGELALLQAALHAQRLDPLPDPQLKPPPSSPGAWGGLGMGCAPIRPDLIGLSIGEATNACQTEFRPAAADPVPSFLVALF